MPAPNITGSGFIPASRNRSHASRAIPPVEVGIDDKPLFRSIFRIFRIFRKKGLPDHQHRPLTASKFDLDQLTSGLGVNGRSQAADAPSRYFSRSTSRSFFT